ncbi:fumarylacetoacetate hydrolase family protein [Streptomyces sp. NPDC059467]|uniref:fumarylacetoacetate hydrolase family protein n=1 Tax=Streptomyces sp. NPDC059467 TaxID=3346844 RepID=UPI003694C1B1
MSPSHKVTPRQTRRAATQSTTVVRADPEGDPGVVIGRPIPGVTTDGALCHVFGHVAADDVSARDVRAAENSGRAARPRHTGLYDRLVVGHPSTSSTRVRARHSLSLRPGDPQSTHLTPRSCPPGDDGNVTTGPSGRPVV